MAQLKATHKTFIVECLARFMSPSEVAEAVKDEFDGLTIERQQVRNYNPEQNPEVGEQWRKLFEQRREAFLNERDKTPLNCLNYRQGARQKLLDIQFDKENPNPILVLSILKDAASDEGGLFAKAADKATPDIAPSPSFDAAILKVYGQKPNPSINPPNGTNPDGSGAS